MDIRQLQAFVAVADNMSFIRAANALHLSQPAVTKRVRALEAEMGVALFTRSRKGVQLTGVGRVLYPRATELSRDFGVLESAVLRRTLPTSEVTVGAAISVAAHVLPDAVKCFAGTEVRVRVGLARDIVEWVRSAIVDIGVTRQTGSEYGLNVTPLYVEELIAVARPDHPLAGRGTVHLSEFVRHPIVAYAYPASFTNILEDLWAKHSLYPNITARIDQVDVLHRFVLRGHGAGFLPSCVIRDDVVAGHLVRLPLRMDPIKYTVVALRRLNRSSETADLLVATLRMKTAQKHAGAAHDAEEPDAVPG